MSDYLKEGWRLDCQFLDDAPTWTEVVVHNLDWYTNPEKHILTVFDPIGWDTDIPARWAEGLNHARTN